MNFSFVTNSENGQVYGANIFSMKEEKLLPVANPMGGEFHTKLISAGELLGFRGELTAKSKFMIWMFLRLIKKKKNSCKISKNQKVFGNVQRPFDFLETY